MPSILRGFLSVGLSLIDPLCGDRSLLAGRSTRSIWFFCIESNSCSIVERPPLWTTELCICQKEKTSFWQRWYLWATTGSYRIIWQHLKTIWYSKSIWYLLKYSQMEIQNFIINNNIIKSSTPWNPLDKFLNITINYMHIRAS